MYYYNMDGKVSWLYLNLHEKQIMINIPLCLCVLLVLMFGPPTCKLESPSVLEHFVSDQVTVPKSLFMGMCI